MTAERPAEHRSPLDADPVQHFERAVGVSGQRVGAARINRVLGLSVAGQIDGDQPATALKELELGSEAFLAERIAMHEQKRRARSFSLGEYNPAVGSENVVDSARDRTPLLWKYAKTF